MALASSGLMCVKKRNNKIPLKQEMTLLKKQRKLFLLLKQK